MAKWAAEIRRAYIDERNRTLNGKYAGNEGVRPYSPGRMWDGYTDKYTGNKRKAIWPAIARFYLAHELDPREYTRHLFQLLRRRGSTPMPNVLMSANHLQAYREWRPQLRHELSTAFEFQKKHARAMLASYAELTEFTREQRWEYLLCAPDEPLTAMFRYCLAVSEQLPNVARMFHDEALQAYLLSPGDYDAVWGEWIPERLKAKARRLRTAAAAYKE